MDHCLLIINFSFKESNSQENRKYTGLNFVWADRKLDAGEILI